jgi:hypothetical protein
MKVEVNKTPANEGQPQCFYRVMGATYLQYNTIEDVEKDFLNGKIDEYTAAQALAYGIHQKMEWEDAVKAVDEWQCRD